MILVIPLNKGVKWIINGSELLMKALEIGTIDITLIQEQVELKERKDLLKKHVFKIWQGTNGSWYTYLPDAVKGRKLVKRNSKKSIEDAIYLYYRDLNTESTVEQVFNEWINDKLAYEEITQQTYYKYKNNFKRFFKNKETGNWGDLHIKYITEDALEDFVRESIRVHELTAKAFSDFKIIIIGIFKHARKKKISNISISYFFGDLELSKKSLKKKTKSIEEEVFFEDEIPKIMNYLKDNKDIKNLGILLSFYTGVRVGELSTLKKTDFVEQKMANGTIAHFVSIQRTEVKVRDENEKWIFAVQENAKTDAGIRNVILSNEAWDIYKQILDINNSGEYLFMRNGTRIRGNYFNRRLDRICKELKMPHRSMHKIRKTYGTLLLDSKTDEALVAEQMGHTDVATTRKYYYYSNKKVDSKVSQIEKALANY